jgi:hypothetical protein
MAPFFENARSLGSAAASWPPSRRCRSGQNGPGPDGRMTPLQATGSGSVDYAWKARRGTTPPFISITKDKGSHPPTSMVASQNADHLWKSRGGHCCPPGDGGTLQGALDGLQHPFQPASETLLHRAVPIDGGGRRNWLGNLRFSSCWAFRGRPNLFFRGLEKPAAESPRFRRLKSFAC